MAVKLSYSLIHPMLRPSIVVTLTPRIKPEDGTSIWVSLTWLPSDGRRRAVARSDISFAASKKKCLNLVCYERAVSWLKRRRWGRDESSASDALHDLGDGVAEGGR